MKSFTAGKNEEGMRLSRYVEKLCPAMPRSLMHKGFRNGRVKVNGKKAKEDSRLHIGDRVELYINDEFFTSAPAQDIPAPQNAPQVQVIYEDENILIAEKPAGLLCHSDNTGDATLLEGITAYLTGKGEFDPQGEQTFRPALCNRLDRGTEGLVIAAKNAPALREMNRLIREGSVQKRYLCVTLGAPPEGVHRAFLLRDLQKKKVEIRSTPFAQAQPICTELHTLETRGRYALSEVTLHTGRTHQIRAHLAFLGNPILGDEKYGDRAQNRAAGVRGQLLCAFSLSFAQLPPKSALSSLSQKVICLQEPAIRRSFAVL